MPGFFLECPISTSVRNLGTNDIRRANLDGTGEQILARQLPGPAGIALDVAAGQMYWTDFVGGDIRRGNLDGSGQQTLVSGLSPPAGIDLDLAGRKMYWTDGNGDIRRANLDGTSQEILVTQQGAAPAVSPCS
jgi:Low-density lipoprotein receptor repeat class B